jgi:hypothetical protein
METGRPESPPHHTIFSIDTLKLWLNTNSDGHKPLNIDENCIQILNADVSYRLKEILNVRSGFLY